MALAGRRCAWLPLAALLSAALVAPVADAANILCIFPTVTKSHHIWNSPLVEALAARGHNLTVLSPTAMKPPVSNVTDLVIEGALDYQDEGYDYQSLTLIPPLEWVPMTFDWYEMSCNYSSGTRGVKQLLDYPDDFHFDLVIVEATGGECLLGFVEKFGRPPLMAVHGFGNPQWINWNLGNPDNPAFVASALLPLHWPFAFAQKLYNVLMHLATLHHYYCRYLPNMDAMLKTLFAGTPAAQTAPPVAETLSSLSLVLVNAHYSLDGSRPLVPALVPIAGMHVRQPKALPKDLQQFLDGASEGAVYMSLGSIVRSDRLGATQLQALVAAFNALPKGVRVLWKWESDAPPGDLPPNVRTSKWLPQSDILAHPNVRVFVSHAGMLSTHEAVWRGVPLAAMPFIVDQFLNAQRLVALGVAQRLDYAHLTRDSVLHTLNDMLTDPGYRERMRELSSVFRARPQPPLDTAVFWVEHVLRHGGAPRMRSPTADIPWYALWLLDVAAVVLAPLLLAALLLCCCARSCLKRRARAQSKKKAE